MARRRREQHIPIAADVVLIVLSVAFAVIIVQSGVIHRLLESMGDFGFLSSFLAGLFFTSAFTTAPAIAALGEIAQTQSIFPTALFGAAGAVIGDLILFRFLKDHFADRLKEMLKGPTRRGRMRKMMKFRLFRYLTFFGGGLVIASPLPDELGLALLGLSGVSKAPLITLSFTFNFIGIVLIGLAAQAIG